MEPKDDDEIVRLHNATADRINDLMIPLEDYIWHRGFDDGEAKYAELVELVRRLEIESRDEHAISGSGRYMSSNAMKTFVELFEELERLGG